MNTAPATPTPPAAETPAPGWQPLPPRGARLYALNHALGFGVPAVLAAAALALSPLAPPWWAMAMTVPAAVAAGAWIGVRRHRRIFWKLDDLGLWLRRGRLWQAETFVPLTRVQHLDLGRGPLQRALRLATLVVHTAGTRAAEVTVPLLDDADAERLRERLSLQPDQDGDAL